ncbi:MAG: glycine dehydrogenase (aminomethyl-transferring) [Actinobacteria bacterium]|nr:glycine dehydrogenase (aminomethyl-transferring) [Actinomycetota bacterium]|tara:strand:- start:460 stop:3303 length:2844 start_codon:yes stop_codon:yes gene_type:complete
MNKAKFIKKHIPDTETDIETMCQSIGIDSLDTLIDQTIPSPIRKTIPLPITPIESEYKFFQHISTIAKKNIVTTSHIGLGYYNTITPPVIQRNIFENPGWYTQYTPYQAEISQGRLEALLNFQTMVSELTQLPIVNASLLDEATAAAEAMLMLFRSQPRNKEQKTIFGVTTDIFPQTLAVLKTRASHLNITLEMIEPTTTSLSDNLFGILFQSPNRFGECNHYKQLIEEAKLKTIPSVLCTDLLYLCFENPEPYIDICVGSSQRFGVPLGFGGPHAAFFATTETYNRQIPGRIIGESIDKFNNKALRMALQTREQHIRKEKATSNICTAQALLAIMAGMYAMYHGPKELQTIATTVHHLASLCHNHLEKLGLKLKSNNFFDTVCFECSDKKIRQALKEACQNQNIEINDYHDQTISIAFDETHTTTDCKTICEIISNIINTSIQFDDHINTKEANRPLTFMKQPIFNTYHSETDMMRYMKQLENKDYSLTTGMIPLGSCTMKLNAAIEMMPLSLPEIGQIHPFSHQKNYQGYTDIINQLGEWLCAITDFDDISFQPNSGAQGEYAGILAIKRYHESQNQHHRHIALIPTSAHGTNPASAVIAGLDVVPITCNEKGDIDLQDLTKKCEQYSNNIALLMLTYPSTHGVFEEDVQSICNLIHQHGGQVYLDGANLNAQVGLTSPGIINADVCHINLHKTFAIPHGGGGPGMGPICVKKHLTKFLPSFSLTDSHCHSVAAAPFSSASILLISYTYIALMGNEGLTLASKNAILKANYIKSKLEPYYPILFTGKHNHVAHELIIDCRHFKKEANITVEDIAKRLIDYSFHAPTLSWPVNGTLMIEPTESESLTEINRFCNAMIHIYNEIQEIINNEMNKTDNVLINAPHTLAEICADNWNHHYSREKAAFPTKSLKTNKFWPTVSRINQAQGDRQLICTCSDSLMQLEIKTT